MCLCHFKNPPDSACNTTKIMPSTKACVACSVQYITAPRREPVFMILSSVSLFRKPPFRGPGPLRKGPLSALSASAFRPRFGFWDRYADCREKQQGHERGKAFPSLFIAHPSRRAAGSRLFLSASGPRGSCPARSSDTSHSGQKTWSSSLFPGSLSGDPSHSRTSPPEARDH